MTAEKPKKGNGERGKFPEPKAWSLQWNLEASSDFGAADGDSLPSEPQHKKGNGDWDKFPQPRGWSLEWDGTSMDALQEFYNASAATGSSESQQGTV